jgi:hypothetical protein
MPEEIEPELVIEGEPSSFTGKGVDAEYVLEKSVEYMNKNNLENPILVCQASQVGRIALQLIKLGKSPIVPKDLPKEFDPKSSQFWTRHKLLWAFREVLAIFYFKLKNKI